MATNQHLQHETLYRGEKALQRRKKARVLLCGGGALGSWLADLLARQGYENLTVLDKDKVEEANFGTQCFGKQDAGRPKSAMIKFNTWRRLGIKVTDIHKELTATNAKKELSNFDLVVDVFDNVPSRQLIRQTCLDRKIPCLHSGLAAIGYFGITWNERYVEREPPADADPDGPCEYPLAANLVILCVGATAEVINRFIDSRERRDVGFWLKSMTWENL